MGHDDFINKLANSYNRRIIELSKLGTLKYLDIEEFELQRMPENQIKV